MSHELEKRKLSTTLKNDIIVPNFKIHIFKFTASPDYHHVYDGLNRYTLDLIDEKRDSQIDQRRIYFTKLDVMNQTCGHSGGHRQEQNDR